MQELLQQAMPVAQAALLQFQSCVRTTLLLSHGYESQEKVGLSVHGCLVPCSYMPLCLQPAAVAVAFHVVCLTTLLVQTGLLSVQEGCMPRLRQKTCTACCRHTLACLLKAGNVSLS